MNEYQRLGFANRIAYLASLSREYGIPIETVQLAAHTLGTNEDFDGLISLLKDLELSGNFD